MPPGIPKGFVRVSFTRRSKYILTSGCQHPNFNKNHRCTECGYSLWTYFRRQIRDLEERGSTLPEEERVRVVVEILTVPFSRFASDGFIYRGMTGRLPRHLKPANAGTGRQSERIQTAIEAAKVAGQRKHTALQLIESSVGLLEGMGFDETEILILKDEVSAFLDAYLARFYFKLNESELWPLILAYAAHIGEISSEEIETNYFLDTEEKRERFKWWHMNLRISEDTLGESARRRLER